MFNILHSTTAITLSQIPPFKLNMAVLRTVVTKHCQKARVLHDCRLRMPDSMKTLQWLVSCFAAEGTSCSWSRLCPKCLSSTHCRSAEPSGSPTHCSWPCWQLPWSSQWGRNSVCGRRKNTVLWSGVEQLWIHWALCVNKVIYKCTFYRVPRNISAFAGFLCDRAAVRWDKLKEIHCLRRDKGFSF
jgi:hypothetical protein